MSSPLHSALCSYLVKTGIVTGGNYNDSTSGEWCQKYSLPNCDHHENGQYKMCSAQPEFPTPKCTATCDSSSAYKTPYTQDKHKFASSYSIAPNVQAIASEILANGPVEAAFTVYEDFLTYKSGVYQHKTGGVDGGHAIKIMGWGSENGTPYWLVANSWNEDWGDKGTFKIIRGKVHHSAPPPTPSSLRCATSPTVLSPVSVSAFCVSRTSAALRPRLLRASSSSPSKRDEMRRVMGGRAGWSRWSDRHGSVDRLSGAMLKLYE